MSDPTSRRAPSTARVVAVTLLWITRTLLSLLVACPLVFAIMSTGLVSGPERDAVLFRPGALLLLELLRTAAPALMASLKTCCLLWAVSAVVALVPLGAALDLLQGQRTEALGAQLLRGFRLFPRFLALSAVTLLAQSALVLAASLLGAALGAALRGHDERLITLAPLLLFALAALGCAWLGALLDVARAASVQHDLAARSALLQALTILRERPRDLLFGCYPSVTGSACFVLCAAWLLTKIDLSRPSTRGIALAFVVHQLAVIGSLALRARWLEGALTLTARLPSIGD
jgi:hypothetical protein